MPIAASVTKRDEPPYEMKGKGIPVRGTSATIEARLKRICMAIREVRAIAKSLPS